MELLDDKDLEDQLEVLLQNRTEGIEAGRQSFILMLRLPRIAKETKMSWLDRANFPQTGHDALFQDKSLIVTSQRKPQGERRCSTVTFGTLYTFSAL